MDQLSRWLLLVLLPVSLAAASTDAAEPERPGRLRAWRFDQATPVEAAVELLSSSGTSIADVISATGTLTATAAPSQKTSDFELRLQRIEQLLDVLESEVEQLQRAIRAQPESASLRRGEPGFRALHVVNRDGTGAEYLVAAPGMIATSDGTWSHDGTQLAMNGLPEIDAFNQSKIFVYTLAGPNAGAIRDLGYGNTPTWSPDDQRMAYMLNPGNPGGAPDGLWVMNADGTNRQRIGRAWYPRWSPDGRLLCCHGWRDNGEATLVLFDPDSGAVRRLLDESGWSLVDYGGSWSPDGQRIAFVGEHEGKRHLATINVDGSNDSIRILFTNHDQNLEMFGPPSWSPDGRQIIFGMQSQQHGPRRWWKSNLYSMAPDIPCAPALLEGRPVGNINRVGSWSPDSSKFVFSSER